VAHKNENESERRKKAIALCKRFNVPGSVDKWSNETLFTLIADIKREKICSLQAKLAQ